MNSGKYSFFYFSVSTNVEKRCKNCGHIIHQDQFFCDKCGNKLGVFCLGEIHGKQCSKFISVESKFCAHCGTANLEKNSGKQIPFLLNQFTRNYFFAHPCWWVCNICINIINKAFLEQCVNFTMFIDYVKYLKS